MNKYGIYNQYAEAFWTKNDMTTILSFDSRETAEAHAASERIRCNHDIAESTVKIIPANLGLPPLKSIGQKEVVAL